MKVLFVQKEGGIFGAENYQLKVIPGLIAKGVRIEFLRLYTAYQGGRGGDFIDRLEALGVKTHQVNIGRVPTPNVLSKIRKIANSGGFDLVHTHLIHADFHLALIKQFLGLKPILISTKHGYDNAFTSKFGFDASKQRNTTYFLISKWAEKRMKASYTISRGLLDFFISTGLTDAKKMKLIHYGFDLPDHFLHKEVQEFRKAPKQLIIAGRLVSFKGHRFLIEAMTKVVEVFGQEVKLLIAGSGDLEIELKNQVTSLALEKNIEFLGYSNAVGQYMANSDIVVIPSISEGFGVVFLEAFAAKTPVVAWNVPAGNELMEHEKTGYLVEPYNTEMLSDQLIKILEAPKDQLKIVDNAYQGLKEYFNLERMVSESVDFYNLVLKSN